MKNSKRMLNIMTATHDSGQCGCADAVAVIYLRNYGHCVHEPLRSLLDPARGGYADLIMDEVATMPVLTLRTAALNL